MFPPTRLPPGSQAAALSGVVRRIREEDKEPDEKPKEEAMEGGDKGV